MNNKQYRNKFRNKAKVRFVCRVSLCPVLGYYSILCPLPFHLSDEQIKTGTHVCTTSFEVKEIK